MAIPINTKSKLEATFHSAHMHHMVLCKGNIGAVNNLLRHIATRMVNEPTPQQARSIDKILRLPK